MEDPNEGQFAGDVVAEEAASFPWQRDGNAIETSGSVRMSKEAFQGEEGLALQADIMRAYADRQHVYDGYTLQADPDRDDLVVSWWPNVKEGSIDELPEPEYDLGPDTPQ